MKAIQVLFLILVLIIGCSKDKDNNPNSSSFDNIPNSVGDYWKYHILSSNGESLGYLDVQIISRTLLPNGNPLTTWVYAYPSFTDTIYKVLSDTSFDEYASYPVSNERTIQVMRYELPMNVGNKYAINPSVYADSVKVVSDSILTVPAGSFDHSLKHDFIGTHYIGNYWNNSVYWFTPTIGNTKFLISVFNLGPDKHNGIYELVEYRLK
jgi:hypothetical protein